MITVHYGAGVDGDDDIYCTVGGVAHCKTDFGDIRFTDNDEDTLLDYWMESKVDSDNAVFWVEVKDDLSTDPVTIYIYYGKADASTTSNGANTFLLFDHFDDNSIDSALWATSGTPTESGTELSLHAVSELVYSKTNFQFKAARLKLKVNTWGTLIDIGFTTALIGEAFGERLVGFGTPTLQVISGVDAAHYTLTNKGAQGAGYRIYDIKWASNNAKFLIDDGSETEHNIAANIYQISTRFQFFIYGSASANFVVDWVCIRNYVNPEPAHSTWGTEESSGGVAYELTVTEYLGFSDSKTMSRTVNEYLGMYSFRYKFKEVAEYLGMYDFKGRMKTVTEYLGFIDSKVRSRTINELLGLFDSKERKKAIHRVYDEFLGFLDSKTRSRFIYEYLGLKDSKSVHLLKIVLEYLGIIEKVSADTKGEKLYEKPNRQVIVNEE